MNDVILEKTDQFNRDKKTASVCLNTEAAKKARYHSELSVNITIDLLTNHRASGDDPSRMVYPVTRAKPLPTKWYTNSPTPITGHFHNLTHANFHQPLAFWALLKCYFSVQLVYF